MMEQTAKNKSNKQTVKLMDMTQGGLSTHESNDGTMGERLQSNEGHFPE
jgi:hypothetical protein